MGDILSLTKDGPPMTARSCGIIIEISPRISDKDRFERAPAPLCEEDWSGARTILRRLEEAGVTNLTDYVRQDPDILMELAAGIRVIDANQAAIALFRAPTKAILMAHLNRLPDLATFYPTTGRSDALLSMLNTLMAGATSAVADSNDMAIDGHPMVLRRSVTITREDDPYWSRVMVGFQDVTRERAESTRARSEHERLALAHRGSKDGIWDWNAEEDWFTASGVAAKIPGLETLEYTRRPSDVMALFHKEDQEKLKDAIRDVFRGESDVIEVEIRVQRRDGAETWVRLRGAAQRTETGWVTRLAGSIRDVTARRAAGAEMRRAKEEAEFASRAKTDLLANMSHELRTPLNAIIGFGQIMDNETFGPVGTPKYREYIGDILSSASHLLEVIGDVLDMARVEANEIQLNEETFDLADAFERVDRLVQTRAAERQIRITRDIREQDFALYGDSQIFRQILLNLMTNAIKYTPEGEQIHIYARPADNTVAPRRIGGLDICVRDTGIGMSDQQVAIAMQPFGRIRANPYAATEGTGLGLPLVKRLVERHGGAFIVQSETDVGTTAIVRLGNDRVSAGPRVQNQVTEGKTSAARGNDYCAVQPPSTDNDVPVMDEAASEHRKTAKAPN